jgi:hypothetical protein
MRWAGDVVCVGDRKITYRVLWEALQERDNFQDLCVDGRIYLDGCDRSRMIEREMLVSGSGLINVTG